MKIGSKSIFQLCEGQLAALGGRYTAPLVNLDVKLPVVVAQLVEWSLPPPEMRSLNPNIGYILSTNCTFL